MWAGIFILIALMLLNPSLKAFKEYSGDIETNKRKVVYKRVANYLIFSVFEKKVYEIGYVDDASEEYSEKYTGFVRNFWRKD